MEETLAMLALGTDSAATPVFIAQSTVDAATGGFTALIGPSAPFIPKNPAGNTLIVASISGLAKAGLTNASVLSIDFSDNAGVSWTSAIQAPVPSSIVAGLAADTQSAITLVFRFTNATFPAAGREFRASVSPVGAHFQSTVNQGSLTIFESPS
jgi:hypothetical protein